MPENWKTYKLGDAPLEILDGDRGKNYPKSSEFTSLGHCLFLSAKNVTKTGFDFSETSFISKERDQLLRKGRLERGDIVLTTRGTVGNSSYYSDSVEYEHIRINSGMVIIRPNFEVIDVRFLYLYMRSKSFKDQIQANQTGSAQPQLPIRDLKSLTVTLPPLTEQQAIASILSSLDDKIELNLQMNRTLEEMAMTLYKHWFVDFGPFQHGKFIDSELGLIPEGWKVKRLEEAADVGSSKRIFLKEYVEHGIPFYRGKEIIQLSRGANISTELYISPERYNEIKDKFGVPLKGDILISSVGTIGVSWLVENNQPFYFKDGNLTWIKNYTYGLNGSFISQWLKSKETQEQIKSATIGSTQQALTITALKALKLILPPIQTSFVKDISEKLNQWNTLFVANKREIETLTTLRDTLLPKLISGEVRVKDAEQSLAEVL